MRRPGRRLTARPLSGGEIENFEAFRAAARRSLPRGSARRHSMAWCEIMARSTSTCSPQPADATEAERVEGTDTLIAEVTHAVRDEMAVRLDDVVLRRTDLGSGCHPGPAALRAVAERMRALLGWSAERGSRTRSRPRRRCLARHGAATRLRRGVRLLITGGTGFIGSRLALAARSRALRRRRDRHDQDRRGTLARRRGDQRGHLDRDRPAAGSGIFPARRRRPRHRHSPRRRAARGERIRTPTSRTSTSGAHGR